MNWYKKEIGTELVNALIKKFGCSPLTAAIMVRRGIIQDKDILFYFENALRFLHNPFMFEDMEDAVDRILGAKEEGEKVLIFGDRDVDGITSTTLLYNAFKEFGIDVSWQIPSGDEVYGLSVKAVENHAANNGTLIVTVDCGISNFKEVEAANNLGIDVIIIDHHKPQGNLPDAAVIINPHIEDCGYPYSDLSGCAVAWKFITAIRFAMQENSGTILQELYKRPICLLNVRPVNDAYVIEAVKLINLVRTGKVIETIVPGMLSFSETRLNNFLSGVQIFVWDAPLQKNQLKKIFGNGIEFGLCDLQPEIAKKFPTMTDMSLVRLKEFSTLGKYTSAPYSELDAFENIFITYAQTLYNFYGKQTSAELQLTALSTIADLMNLTDENRIIVKQGLIEMNKKSHYAIAELFAKQNLSSIQVGSEEIAWNISPLINAAGRMGKPEIAIEFFTATDSSERTEKLEEICKMNEQRKSLVAKSWEIALPIAINTFNDYHQKIAIAVSDKFYRGITGILSGKLAEYFKTPSIVICLMQDGTAVASLRSARNFVLLELLEPLKDFFVDYGGHEFAAGFTIMQEKLPDFLNALKKFSYTLEFDSKDESEIIHIDAELPHSYLTPDILNLTAEFEPYGPSSPLLTFMAKNLKIINANIVGKTEPLHLKLTLDCGKYKWNAVYWKAAEKLNVEFKAGDFVDCVFHISKNIFNGTVTPQMTILDMKRSEK